MKAHKRGKSLVKAFIRSETRLNHYASKGASHRELYKLERRRQRRIEKLLELKLKKSGRETTLHQFASRVLKYK